MAVDMYNTNDKSVKVLMATFLTNIFSIEEVERLLDNMYLIDLYSKRKIEIEKVKIFDFLVNRKEDFIQIFDVLNMNKFPILRYLEVIIGKKSKIFNIRLKYDRNIYNNLIEVICRSYNMLRYKSDNKDQFNISNNAILNNYAKSIVDILPLYSDDTLKDIKYISNSLFSDYRNIHNNDAYVKYFKINSIVNIEVSSKSKDIIKFQINVKGKRRMIFLNKSIIGIHNISLIINKINKYKNKKRKRIV